MNRLLSAASLLALLAPAASAQWDFRPMPDLPGGAFMSKANSLAGGIAVGVSSGVSGDEAVRWDTYTGALTALSDLPGGPFASEAFASSQDGAVVFGYGTNAAGNQEAFRWTTAGMAPLGFLDGGSISRAYACSYYGTVACGESVSGAVTQAFRWTAAGMQPLGFLPGDQTFSTARAMSWDGAVIVGWAKDAAGVTRPFRWTAAAGMVDISGGTFAGEARATDGSAIVGVNRTSSQAFIWTEAAGTLALPPIDGATTSEAIAMAGPNRVVGISGGHACHWDTGNCGYLWSARPIDTYVHPPAGWNLLEGRGTTYEFSLGNGTNPSGQPQGWYIWDQPAGNGCCCGVDFNCDGDMGTDADIADFFACLAGRCPTPPCPYNADFNQDGDIGTDADIEAFIRVLAGGCC